jgi:Holliday junction resolvase RusA-like endonuclease
MIRFTVYGKPEPAGSKRGFAFKRKNGSTGVAISDANPRSRDWKNAVASAAVEEFGEIELLRGALSVRFTFHLVRPKGHYGTGRNSHVLKDSAPTHPTGKPDVLKLSRGVEDALTGVLWADDAQIVDERIEKIYGERFCVAITIMELSARQQSLLA